MRTVLIVLLLCGLLAAGEKITVTIDYGKDRPARTVTAVYENGTTALAVLQSVADVRTKKVGIYTFITSIDGVRSTPQKMGWFYSVDGRHADKTASGFLLENAKTMRWEYRADHCLR